MIKITDMTLSCLVDYHPSSETLVDLHDCLLLSGADYIEMPVSFYEKLKPPEPLEKYILRISDPKETEKYPEISRFICKIGGIPSISNIISEVQINDQREIHLLYRYGALKSIRLTGLDDILCYDYESAFKNIKKQLKSKIEFCPENNFHCATALAVEWIIQGGTDVVTSFGGVGGKAPFEEVMIALRIQRRHKSGASFEIFPRIAALIEEITAMKFDDRKAVIGKKIFDVESGIHVDGILKQPKMYEPYHPKLVGASRKIVIGKHSGKKAIISKLSELGFKTGEYQIEEILSEVRCESVKKMSGLRDDEFIALVKQYKK